MCLSEKLPGHLGLLLHPPDPFGKEHDESKFIVLFAEENQQEMEPYRHLPRNLKHLPGSVVRERVFCI